MIVALFRWFATFFLALMGSSEGPFTEMNCVLAWLGLYCDPESVRLGLSVDGVCVCVLVSILSCSRLVDRVSVF